MFKDDQIQDHLHNFIGGYGAGSKGSSWLRTDGNNPNTQWYAVREISVGRAGTVTRGKRKGVKYIVKVL